MATEMVMAKVRVEFANLRFARAGFRRTSEIKRQRNTKGTDRFVKTSVPFVVASSILLCRRFALLLVSETLRIFLIDRFDFQQREETFFFFGRTNLTGDEIPGLQIETANLRWRNVDVFGTRQVIETLRPKETKAFRQNLQNALGEQNTSTFCILLKDMENHLMFAHRAEIFDVQLARHLVEFSHGHRLKLGNVKRRGSDFVFVFSRLALVFVLFLSLLDRLRWLLCGGLLPCRLGRRWFGNGHIRRREPIQVAVCQFGARHLGALRLSLFRRGSWHNSNITKF